MGNDKKEYKLSGMTCAACAMTIEMVVKELSTVEDATVNLATEKLTVLPKEGFASEQVLEAVKEAGYQAAENGEHCATSLYFNGEHDWFAVSFLFGSHDASHCFCISAAFPYFTGYLGRLGLLCAWLSEFGETASEYG